MQFSCLWPKVRVVAGLGERIYVRDELARRT